jgi:cell division septation protein DedD
MGRWGTSFFIIGMMWGAALGQPATNPATEPSTSPATQAGATQSSATEASTQPQTPVTSTTSTAPSTEAASQPQTQTASRPSTLASTEPASRSGIAVDASTPRGAIKVLDRAIAMGDVEAFIGIVRTQSDIEARVVRAYAENRAALVAFRSAMWSKFPPSASERDSVTQRLMQVMQQVDQWRETIDGDSASVGRDSQPAGDRIGLSRVDGKWKVNFSSVFKPQSGDLAEHSRALEIETRVFQQLAEETAAGKYQSVDELRKASTALMQSVLSSATSTQPAISDATTAPTPTTQPATTQQAITAPVSTQPATAPTTEPATEPSAITQPVISGRPATTENSADTRPAGVSTIPAQ